MHEAKRLLQHLLLGTDRELATQYRQGHIDAVRQGLTRITGMGDERVTVLQRRGTRPAPLAVWAMT